VHRFNFSTIDFARKVAMRIYKANYRGLVFLKIKHPLSLNCGFETCPEDGISQHAHIVFPPYNPEDHINDPLSSEITDIIENLYQYVKTNNLYFIESPGSTKEISVPTNFPAI